MRLTIRLDDEVYAAAKRAASARGISLGQAVNELARDGLRHPSEATEFTQKTYSMGMKVDCTNIGEVLDILDAAAERPAAAG